MMWTINKAETPTDFDEGCFELSDGGQYTAQRAIAILEAGHGGTMTNELGQSYRVSYDCTKNQWVKSQVLNQ